MAEPQTRTETAAPETDNARATIFKSQGWKTLYNGSERSHTVENTGGIAQGGERIELEVEADGSSQGSIGKGQEMEVEAKKLRIRALCQSISYNHF